jgi:hypothetical protein
MRRRASFYAVLLYGVTVPNAYPQPAPLSTLENKGLLFAAADLTTNGVPGLTNGAPKLMVSAVSAFSAQGGRVALVTTQVWARTYTGSGAGGYADGASKVVADSHSNVYVTGSSYQPGTLADFTTIKYGANGTALWTNRYDGPAHLNDGGKFLGLDGDDNVYVAGGSAASNSVQDIAVVKYSASGACMWTNRYNSYGTNFEQMSGLAVDQAGNSYISFSTFIPGGPPSSCVTLKYDSLGHPVWTNRYNAAPGGPDTAIDVAVDLAGNVLIAGRTYAGRALFGADFGFGFGTLKYSPNGACLWTNRYTRAHDDNPRAMVLDRSGNVTVTGESYGNYSNLYATVSYSPTGAPVWTNLLAGPGYSGGYVLLAASPAGEVYFAGGSPGSAQPNDMTLVKFSSQGAPLWTNRLYYSNLAERPIVAMAVDSAGGCHVAGYSAAPDSEYWDYVTVKYASGGGVLWTNRFDGAGHSDDIPFDITVDGAGNVFVTGESQGGVSYYDFATVKYGDYLSYHPPENFVGEDSFAFTATDYLGNSTTGVVVVAVRAPALQFNTQPAYPTLTADGFRSRVDGAVGTNPVILLASTNLVNWNAIATNPAASGSVEFLDLATTNSARRFYRAFQVQ